MHSAGERLYHQLDPGLRWRGQPARPTRRLRFHHLGFITSQVTTNDRPPVATDDAYIVAREHAADGRRPGRARQRHRPRQPDPHGHPRLGTRPTAAVKLNADGSFTYSPATGFSGADSFTYKANDGQLRPNVATVHITVAAPVRLDPRDALGRFQRRRRPRADGDSGWPGGPSSSTRTRTASSTRARPRRRPRPTARTPSTAWRGDLRRRGGPATGWRQTSPPAAVAHGRGRGHAQTVFDFNELASTADQTSPPITRRASPSTPP